MDNRSVLSKRVFLNHVDSYSSKYIAKYLSTCVVGASARAGDTDDEDEDQPPTDDYKTFTVVGTVSADSQEKAPFLHDTYPAPNREQLLDQLLESDVVVYNISGNPSRADVDEAQWAITEIHSRMKTFKSQKIFILVSSVMTWAMTKLPDADDTDASLMDHHYVKRRPHPTFTHQNKLEKLVLKLGREKKSKLRGYVVVSGLQYGRGENMLHYFFKASWSMELAEVPLFGPGDNTVPMIHIQDLAGVIQNIIDHHPKRHYILAVDESHNTLEEIVTTITEVLGPGKIKKLPKEEAVAMNALRPEELEYLSVDLRLEASLLKEHFRIRWVSENGLIDNIDNIVDDYKHTRQLLPIKIFLSGPPAVGKTTVGQKLCHHYRLPHIKIDEVVQERITQLEERLKAGSDDTEEDITDVLVETRNQLEVIQDSMAKNAGQLADNLIVPILQDKLNSRPCTNQGFVLDGFPETYEQAKSLFAPSLDKSDSLDGKSKVPMYNQRIAPEHVFVLNGSDALLSERAMAVPQSVAEEQGYTCQALEARLARYRLASCQRDTVWDYFDEMEIHLEQIEVSSDDPESAAVLSKIKEEVGEPKNYGRSPEEREAEERSLVDAWKKRLALETIEQRQRNEAGLAQHKEWVRDMAEVKSQNTERLEVRALPLRNYLMKYVMPTLSQAMLDCCAVKPEDPIDYLAEQLLGNNSQDST